MKYSNKTTILNKDTITERAKTFFENLKIKEKLTNQMVSNQTGISKETIDSISSGRNCTAESLARICSAYSREEEFFKICFDENYCPEEDDYRLQCLFIEDFYSKQYVPINNSSLIDEFYGYTHSTVYNELDKFKLSILNDSATMELEAITEEKGEIKTVQKKLSGMPMMLNDIVIIMFQDADTDDLYIMAIKSIAVRNDSRVNYRCGSLITIQRNEEKLPEIQKFVLLNKELNENDYKYMLGNLKLNEDTFYIEKNDFNAIFESTDFTGLLDMIRSERIIPEKKVFKLSESDLLNFLKNNNVPTQHAGKLLLTLLDKSVSPDKVNAKNWREYYKFFSSL